MYNMYLLAAKLNGPRTNEKPFAYKVILEIENIQFRQYSSFKIIPGKYPPRLFINYYSGSGQEKKSHYTIDRMLERYNSIKLPLFATSDEIHMEFDRNDYQNDVLNQQCTSLDIASYRDLCVDFMFNNYRPYKGFRKRKLKSGISSVEELKSTCLKQIFKNSYAQINKVKFVGLKTAKEYFIDIPKHIFDMIFDMVKTDKLKYNEDNNDIYYEDYRFYEILDALKLSASKTGYEVVDLDCFVFDIIEHIITKLKEKN